MKKVIFCMVSAIMLLTLGRVSVSAVDANYVGEHIAAVNTNSTLNIKN